MFKRSNFICTMTRIISVLILLYSTLVSNTLNFSLDAFAPFPKIYILDLSENPDLRDNLPDVAVAMTKAKVVFP